MSKRFVVLGLVLTVSLAVVASAIAGGSISSVSESANVAAGQTKTLTAKCHGDAEAVAGGFKGAIRGNFSTGLTALYALTSRVDGHEAIAKEVNVSMGADGARATGYGYCGSPSVSEAEKTVRIRGGRTGGTTAKCPDGRTPVSGGFKGSLSISESSGTIATSSTRSGGGWKVGGVSAGSTSNGQRSPLTAYAYCAKGTAPLKSRMEKVTLKAPTFTGSIKATNIDVSCEPGERVVSGGYRPALAASVSNGPITVSSYRKSADTWRVSSAVSQQNARMIVYAYCRDK